MPETRADGRLTVLEKDYQNIHEDVAEIKEVVNKIYEAIHVDDGGRKSLFGRLSSVEQNVSYLNRAAYFLTLITIVIIASDTELLKTIAKLFTGA